MKVAYRSYFCAMAFNTNFNVNEVLEFYTGQYPELTTASVQGPEVKEDKIIYQFKNNVGTKG